MSELNLCSDTWNLRQSSAPLRLPYPALPTIHFLNYSVQLHRCAPRHSSSSWFGILSKCPHDKPVYGKENDHEKCSHIEKHSNRQRRIGSGKQSMQRCAETDHQTQKLYATEQLRADFLAQIECERYQQKDIKSDNA